MYHAISFLIFFLQLVTYNFVKKRKRKNGQLHVVRIDKVVSSLWTQFFASRDRAFRPPRLQNGVLEDANIFGESLYRSVFTGPTDTLNMQRPFEGLLKSRGERVKGRWILCRDSMKFSTMQFFLFFIAKHLTVGKGGEGKKVY